MQKKRLTPSEWVKGILGILGLFWLFLLKFGIKDWREGLVALAVLGGLGTVICGSAWVLYTYVFAPKQDITVGEELERRLAANSKADLRQDSPTEVDPGNHEPESLKNDPPGGTEGIHRMDPPRKAR